MVVTYCLLKAGRKASSLSELPMREQRQVGKGARKEKAVSVSVSHQFMLRSCWTRSEQSVDKGEEKIEKNSQKIEILLLQSGSKSPVKRTMSTSIQEVLS